jgi:O-antigen ligase
MNVVTATPVATVLRFLRNRSLWTTIADVFAILTAISLPWSTSLVAIFILCWLGAVALVMDYRAYVQSLKWPICFLPFALIGLALVGTLWSDAPWSDQLLAIGQTFKLIVLPALFYHFARSTRGMWVFVAFLVSCAVLMAVSWVVVFYPGLTFKDELHTARGILVKNYIDQSQEFALCAVALAYPIIRLLQARKFLQAASLAAIALGFVVNMSFVIVSRTAMVTMPIMLAVFALLHLKRRTSLLIFGAGIVAAGLIWAAAPQLREKTSSFLGEYETYKESNAKTSIGLRLEYWRKSLKFFVDAPLVGHGTGSILGLFERAAVGDDMVASGVAINNPHNQTLNVAVQWGVVGIVVLYAMWFFHLRLFRGEGLAAWIGLLVVVQNIFTSLFNSHIFDFHEGWMYVLGVGVAGGMTLRAARQGASTEPADTR